MFKLNAIARRFLSPSLKTLNKAGFIDNNNELTDDGREALEAIVLEKYLNELVIEAEKILKEEK